MEIRGKRIVITGAAGSIGRATAARLLAAGAQVSAWDTDEAGLQQLQRQLGVDVPRLAIHVCDVSDADAVLSAASHSIEQVGAVDALINNAGVLEGIGPMWRVAPERWRRDLEVNLYGTFVCIRALLPHMRGRGYGTIINLVGGGLGAPNPAGSGYGCSKVALARLTDTLAEELADMPGLRVFALAPGFVRSAITEELAGNPEAQPWFHYCRDWLEQEKDNTPESVAESFLSMVRFSDRLPTGRVFRYSDDFEKMATMADEIVQRDIRQVRFIEE